jgi:hypothetical protein
MGADAALEEQSVDRALILNQHAVCRAHGLPDASLDAACAVVRDGVEQLDRRLVATVPGYATMHMSSPLRREYDHNAVWIQRWRRPILLSALALAALVGVVRAQQATVQLVDDDDVSITCPTELSVTFDDASTATVSCAAEPRPESTTQDAPPEPLP